MGTGERGMESGTGAVRSEEWGVLNKIWYNNYCNFYKL